MLPTFLLRREKYAAGFRQRLGSYPEINHDGRKVIWLHCVSVGETNAASPLVDQLISKFPGHRLVISTTTKTGQELAQKLFGEKAEAVFYFPLDFKFSVRTALKAFRPSVVLLMETEIWPRFFREARLFGAKVVIVNGRLSARSFARYNRIGFFIKDVLSNAELALMQGDADAERMSLLGMATSKVRVTGNIKFDQPISGEYELTEEFRSRFGLSDENPLIVAASTHDPEEGWVLEAFAKLRLDESARASRLLIAPRHPERFEAVDAMIRSVGRTTLTNTQPLEYVRRSHPPSAEDKSARVVLLDSIGELRAAYPLAKIVFVGGSLIPHGGQSVLEPAAAGKAIITGPYTHNFDAVVKEFLANQAIIQLTAANPEQIVDEIFSIISELFKKPIELQRLGNMASRVMAANQGASARTIEMLEPIIHEKQAELR